MSAPAVAKVTPSLEPLLVPIDSVRPHPENPNEGDPEGIAASLARYGQYAPIVVQRSTGYILKGEHTWRAAHLHRWTHIAANVGDYSDADAAGILAGDNRWSERSHRDPDKLGPLLARLANEDDGLLGTGYDHDDLADLLGAGDPLDDLADAEPPPTVIVHTYGKLEGVAVGTARVLADGQPTIPAPAAQPFSPNLAPNLAAANVTDAHIARAQAEAAARFSPPPSAQIAVTCPHCAQLFYIDKDEKGHTPR